MNLMHRIPWFSFLTLFGLAAAVVVFSRRTHSKYPQIDRKIRRMFREEELQSRNFPKEIDLEPLSD